MVESNKLLLNSLKKSPKGLTAYQILNIVLESKSIQPMTIYRALKNLTKSGLIHKTNKIKLFIFVIQKKFVVLLKHMYTIQF